MKNRVWCALLLIGIASGVLADDRAVATNYLRARCATLAKGATAADVEKVVELFAENAVIEHPKFGAVVKGRDAIRRGLLSHVGEYTGDSEESGVLLLEVLSSTGAVALKTRTTFVVGENAERKTIVREGMAIVEVSDGRISRLIEY